MHELRVDPEFRDKIPPLTDAEFDQLRENILSDGEVYEPIVVWNGTIIDGHNRWRIIQEHPEIPYKIKEMEFADKWTAFEWMYRKQLGRRNLTEQQRSYMIGKMYEARKNGAGNKTSGRNANGTFQSGQNVQDGLSRRETKDGTAGQIGKEVGLDGRSVRRNADFSQGVDAIAEVSQEAAHKILDGKSTATKSAVSELKDATKEEVKQFAESVLADKPIKAKPRPQSKELKEFNKKLNDIVETMENGGTEYTIDDAVCDLSSAEDTFLMQIRFVLTERKAVINTERGREEFEHFIKTVIDDLNELKGELK